MTQAPADSATNVYTFGDSERAAERLYWLAHTFEASTLSFVENACAREARCCVDLGAGPGFLTAALHRTLTPRTTVGLESSANFIAFGSPYLPEGASLRAHDVTQPLPVAGDVLVSRFLLTHLRDPLAALCTWHESTAPGALLLLEELVSMRSPLPELTLYYGLVDAVQRAVGQDMTVGRRIAALAEQAGFAQTSAEVVSLAIPVRIMARLHALNLPTLRLQPVVRKRYEAAELDALSRRLDELAGSDHDTCVAVDMAQCAARRC